jgi:hypothetical protein
MKEKTTLVLLFFLLFCKNISVFFNFNHHFVQANPLEITKLSEKEFDRKISMSINTNDPIGYLKLKVKQT